MKTVDPMKDPDKLRSFIDNATLCELTDFIGKNWTMLPKYDQRIQDRISGFKVKISPTSLILLSKLNGFKFLLKASLKVFVNSLINGIIFIGKNLAYYYFWSI